MKFTKQNLDALREICAIGAGHASTALSELSNKPVKVSFPSAAEYQIEKIPAIIGDPGMLVATVQITIDGKMDRDKKVVRIGNFLLIFPKDEGIRFVELIKEFKTPDNQKPNKIKSNDFNINSGEHNGLDDFALDALKETGNTLSGASLNVVSEFLNFHIVESLPMISVDMLNATMDGILANMAYAAEKAIVFTTKFNVNGEEIKSYFLMLFDPYIYPMLLDKIKKAGGPA